jgi:hypothetical protein
LVEPGFNSGWLEITGMSSNTDDFDPEDDLVSFDGKGKYSDPEFEWRDTLGLTAVKFVNSDKLGAEYVNDMFVGDIVNGRIYHFEFNQDRTELAQSPTAAAAKLKSEDRVEAAAAYTTDTVNNILDKNRRKNQRLTSLSFHVFVLNHLSVNNV